MRTGLYLLLMLGSLAAAAGVVQLRTAGTISVVDTLILFFFLGAFYFAGTVLIDRQEIEAQNPPSTIQSDATLTRKYFPSFLFGFGLMLGAVGHLLHSRGAHKLIIAGSSLS
jgi:hypothetical protein